MSFKTAPSFPSVVDWSYEVSTSPVGFRMSFKLVFPVLDLNNEEKNEKLTVREHELS